MLRGFRLQASTREIRLSIALGHAEIEAVINEVNVVHSDGASYRRIDWLYQKEF